jgi:hypothetical protein
MCCTRSSLKLYLLLSLVYVPYHTYRQAIANDTVTYKGERTSATKSTIETIHGGRRYGEHSRYPELHVKPTSAVFYNAFVNPKNYNKSLSIIKEQMEQIQNSTHQSSVIYYNLIGQYVPESLVCGPTLKCQRIRHLIEGEEVVTLQDLFEYCLDHPLDTVVYLHDKGSFNSNGNNQRIRRLATVSAISQSCRDSLDSGICNVCVNKFMLLPNHHTPGAMWTGRCSYLSTLIPPKDFDEKRQEMFRSVRANKTSLDLYCISALVDNFEDGKAFNGDQWKYMSIFRYAMEHWALSGPLLEPCTTVPGKMASINPKTWIPKATPGIGETNLGFERATTTGWYQFEGRKFEMQYLYGRLPPKSSFFYETYRNAKVTDYIKMKC